MSLLVLIPAAIAAVVLAELLLGMLLGRWLRHLEQRGLERWWWG